MAIHATPSQVKNRRGLQFDIGHFNGDTLNKTYNIPSTGRNYSSLGFKKYHPVVSRKEGYL